MKKILALILVMIIALGLVACAETNNSDNPVDVETSVDGTFTINYDLGSAAEHFTSTPTKAKPGDTIEIKTEILFDADMHVYVDGNEISKSHYDSDYWGYSFVMPEKNILVTMKFYTKDEIWGTGTD